MLLGISNLVFAICYALGSTPSRQFSTSRQLNSLIRFRFAFFLFFFTAPFWSFQNHKYLPCLYWNLILSLVRHVYSYYLALICLSQQHKRNVYLNKKKAQGTRKKKAQGDLWIDQSQRSGSCRVVLCLIIEMKIWRVEAEHKRNLMAQPSALGGKINLCLTTNWLITQSGGKIAWYKIDHTGYSLTRPEKWW